MKKILILNLKKQYFEEIKNGTKLEEYREIKEFWTKRLSKDFSEIHIKLGYPPKEDNTRTMKFEWNGFKIKEITHPLFGEEKIKVYAINLDKKI